MPKHGYKHSYEARIKIIIAMRKYWKKSIDYPASYEKLWDMAGIEPSICDYFGCAKPLGLTEKLCGNKCFEHMNNKVALFNNGKL